MAANPKPKPMGKPMPKPKGKRTSVRGIEIDKAENGYTTKTRYNTNDDSYDSGDTHVHPDEASLADFVKGLFSGGDNKSRRVAAARSMMGKGSKSSMMEM